MTVDTEELTALQALLAKMTPGEWVAHSKDTCGAVIYGHAAGGAKYIADSDDCYGDDAAGIVALVNAAPALIASAARAAELEAKVDKLLVAISWIDTRFADAATSHDELKKRVGFCIADTKRAILGEIA